jgi:hypothetical protein
MGGIPQLVSLLAVALAILVGVILMAYIFRKNDRRL